MSAYPKYKKCDGDWIKEIPQDWDIVRGKYLFEIKKRIAGELGHNVLSITQKGIKVKDTESGDGQLSMDYSKYQIVEPGDFAMNHMDLLTGYVDLSKFYGVTSPDYRVFTAKEKAQCSRFFLYVLQMGYTNKVFFKYGQGASHLGRWRLPTESFNNFWFPCPPPEDREKIVDYLDQKIGKIDKLIDEQLKLLRLFKEKIKVVMFQVVTKGIDPDVRMRDSEVAWLGDIPEHWEALPIKYLSEFVGTGGTPKDSASFSNKKDVSWFTPGDFNGDLTLSVSSKYITKESIDKGDSKLYPAGSVLIIGIGATLGKAAFCESAFSCNQQINIVKPNHRVKGKFLTYSLLVQDEQMKQSSNSSTIGIMNQEKTKQVRLAVPPLNEQDSLVDFLEKKLFEFSSILLKAEQQIGLLKERRTALISAAVTGKIDIRNSI